MPIRKLGPFALTPSEPARRWARVAKVVKARGNPRVLYDAAPDAYKVWLHMPGQSDQSLDRDPQQAVDAAVDSLGGIGREDPRFFVALTNEWKGKLPELADLAYWLERASVRAAERGYGLAGPGWSSGDYGQAEWDFLRRRRWAGLRAILVHAYWGRPHDPASPRRVFTGYNAFRWMTYWSAGDPPVIVGECGRDRVRDGWPTVDDGWVGKKGWRNDGLTDEEYLAELRAYDAALVAHPGTIGACVFAAGPTGDWEAYTTDPVSDRIAAETEWTPLGPGTGGTTMLDPKVSRFGTWAVQRFNNGDDPRDLASFAEHIAATGGDPRDLTVYGVPVHGGAPPAPDVAEYLPKVEFYLCPKANIRGTFAATPKGFIIHGSRSGQTRTELQEYESTARYCKAGGGPQGLAWQNTVGPDRIAVHMLCSQWGYHAGSANDEYLGSEFAQAKPGLMPSDGALNAYCWWVANVARKAHPTIPLEFFYHSEKGNGPADGKTDLFMPDTEQGRAFKAKIRKRLALMGLT